MSPFAERLPPSPPPRPATRLAESDVEPRFFGPAASPLFGCYHAPPGAPRQTGAVLCAPFGQESLRAHRALRLLATWLARAGMPVLRFDLHGCGDSAGAHGDGDLGRWTADTAAAADELRAVSGARRVALVGLRLGASLALLAADGRDDVDRLVLWEPVDDGPAYLAQLLAVHRRWHESMFAKPAPDGAAEALGFPLGARLRAGLEALALPPATSQAGRRILVVEETPSTPALAAALRENGADVEHCSVEGARIGTNPGELGHLWVPAAALQAIESWLAAHAR